MGVDVFLTIMFGFYLYCYIFNIRNVAKKRPNDWLSILDDSIMTLLAIVGRSCMRKLENRGVAMLQNRGDQRGERRATFSLAQAAGGARRSLRKAALISAAVVGLVCQATGGAVANDSFTWQPARIVPAAVNQSQPEFSLMPPPPAAVNPAEEHGQRGNKGHAAKSNADSSNHREGGRMTSRDWWMSKRDILGDAPDMVRYVANECVLAGVAGAAVAVALTVTGGAVGPVASAALGVTQEMSTLSITALGCVAGAAAGAASAVAIYAYEEPETIRDFAVEQAENVQYAVAAVADAVYGVARHPVDTMYAAAAGAWNVAAAAVSGVGGAVYAVAGVTQSSAGAVVAAAAGAANGVGSWLVAPTKEEAVVAFDVASIPGLSAAADDARVY